MPTSAAAGTAGLFLQAYEPGRGRMDMPEEYVTGAVLDALESPRPFGQPT